MQPLGYLMPQRKSPTILDIDSIGVVAADSLGIYENRLGLGFKGL
jgi:hypothetical protein